jgi:beta-lactamase class A
LPGIVAAVAAHKPGSPATGHPMPNLTRRHLLRAATALPLAWVLRAEAKPMSDPAFTQRLVALESQFSGRLGVHAFRADSGASIAHRSDERFPMCSTAKLLVVGAVLHRSERDASLLDRRVDYKADALVTYSPITGKHVGSGMTVRELCAATITYSDNTAANLLIGLLGGPAAVTAFARSIGDRKFRLDRWETALNSAIPGDERDTTTPEAMAHTLRRLALDDALGMAQSAVLRDWLIGNTTGATRIRAGVPAGWTVGDKTGTGAYGSTNDVGIVWPTSGAPIIVAIYTTQKTEKADSRVDIVAAAASIVAEWGGATPK